MYFIWIKKKKILQIGTFYTLTHQTLMNELQQQLGNIELWQKQMKAHWTNNDSSLQHAQCSTATGRGWHNDKSDKGKAWPPNTPSAWEAEDDIQQQTPTPENNTQDLGEQMHGSHEAKQRCPQRHASPTSKYKFFGRHGIKYHVNCLRMCGCCQTSRQEC